jgi:prepilin-type N-terminal cleavage/methylation domain-containing protein
VILEDRDKAACCLERREREQHSERAEREAKTDPEYFSLQSKEGVDIMKSLRTKAFTLIELLIVVAIIAILAAIAVPNFLEAQVRSKISRARSDMRTLATAIESYAVDQGRAPLGYWEYYNAKGNVPVNQRNWCFIQLTTPVAYMTSWLKDPFGSFPPEGETREESKFYYYETVLPGPYQSTDPAYSTAHSRGYTWITYSVGPRKLEEEPWIPWMLAGLSYSLDVSLGGVYDATNGTVSKGKLYRTNKGDTTGSEIASCYGR